MVEDEQAWIGDKRAYDKSYVEGQGGCCNVDTEMQCRDDGAWFFLRGAADAECYAYFVVGSVG